MRDGEKMASKVMKRNELKYLITIEQYNKFKYYIEQYLEKDQYYKTKIKNIYYDTSDYLLIRRSIDKPIYKEKIRIRTYNEGINPNVFVEIKKKFNSVVYKRRVELPYIEAIKLLNQEEIKEENQIINEIKYFISFYNNLKPMLYLSYDRLSYYSKDDKNLRITFDFNIEWLQNKIDFVQNLPGNKILEPNYILMEIKTEMGYPLWLNEFLSNNKIYKTSFSKYGNAYKQILEKEKEKKYGQTLDIA